MLNYLIINTIFRLFNIKVIHYSDFKKLLKFSVDYPNERLFPFIKSQEKHMSSFKTRLLSGTSRNSQFGSYTKFRPQPKNSSSGIFSKLVNFVRGGLNTATDVATSGIVNPEYQQLIERQMELQQQMMLVSMHSNLEKSKHDTRMAPVRNIRVS